jgi:hypothetical protein
MEPSLWHSLARSLIGDPELTGPEVASQAGVDIGQARRLWRALGFPETGNAVAFTQADLEAGRITFTHDGTNTSVAGFDVVVADHTGATSGAPQSVTVTVRG